MQERELHHILAASIPDVKETEREDLQEKKHVSTKTKMELVKLNPSQKTLSFILTDNPESLTRAEKKNISSAQFVY